MQTLLEASRTDKTSTISEVDCTMTGEDAESQEGIAKVQLPCPADKCNKKLKSEGNLMRHMTKFHEIARNLLSPAAGPSSAPAVHPAPPTALPSTPALSKAPAPAVTPTPTPALTQQGNSSAQRQSYNCRMTRS